MWEFKKNEIWEGGIFVVMLTVRDEDTLVEKGIRNSSHNEIIKT